MDPLAPLSYSMCSCNQFLGKIFGNMFCRAVRYSIVTNGLFNSSGGEMQRVPSHGSDDMRILKDFVMH